MDHPKITAIMKKPYDPSEDAVWQWAVTKARRWRIGCEDLIYRLSKQEQLLTQYLTSKDASSPEVGFEQKFFEEMRKLEERARNWHEELGLLKHSFQVDYLRPGVPSRSVLGPREQALAQNGTGRRLGDE
ncbi:MAG: hypothetical protein Q9209_001709 [Squamulea sp. 1 TL-2023]